MAKTISYTKSFIKDAYALKKRGFDIDQLNPLIEKLRSGEPLAPTYKDHQLKGNLKAFREFHLKGDLLVLYKSSNTELEFYAIDNHKKDLGNDLVRKTANKVWPLRALY